MPRTIPVEYGVANIAPREFELLSKGELRNVIEYMRATDKAATPGANDRAAIMCALVRRPFADFVHLVRNHAHLLPSFRDPEKEQAAQYIISDWLYETEDDDATFEDGRRGPKGFVSLDDTVKGGHITAGFHMDIINRVGKFAGRGQYVSLSWWGQIINLNTSNQPGAVEADLSGYDLVVPSPETLPLGYPHDRGVFFWATEGAGKAQHHRIEREGILNRTIVLKSFFPDRTIIPNLAQIEQCVGQR